MLRPRRRLAAIEGDRGLPAPRRVCCSLPAGDVGCNPALAAPADEILALVGCAPRMLVETVARRSGADVDAKTQQPKLPANANCPGPEPVPVFIGRRQMLQRQMRPAILRRRQR